MSVAIKLAGGSYPPLSRPYKLSFFLKHCATFFAMRAWFRMMSGDECRAKARLSLDLANHMPGAELEAEWRVIARDWLRLGVMADYQDRMQCD